MDQINLSEPYLITKGKLIGGGISGIVELADSGYAIKTPWPGEDNLASQEDLQLEARVYKRLSERLGAHPRFVRMISFDQDQLTLTMEYMANGTLREYLQSHATEITLRQRHVWVRAMAEGLDLLHGLGIIHCDLTPHNMLLDDKLELKIADFGGCSMDQSVSRTGTDVRFYPPPRVWNTPVTKDDDLFALGSCIYEILTGAAPFADILSPQARNLARLHQFPDLVGVEFRDVIRDCWLGRTESSKQALSRILLNQQ